MIAAPSYPRRQRYVRLARAVEHGVLAFVTLLIGVATAAAGRAAPAIFFATAGVGFTLRSRRWVRLARRSGVGARSEQRVRRRLRELEREGWTVRHALRWPGSGDVDHIAVAPPCSAIVFAIETKTRSYLLDDLARTAEVAAWLAGTRAARGSQAVPVLCLARSGGVERWEGGVAVLSLDRLVAVLRRLAGTTRRPSFLR